MNHAQRYFLLFYFAVLILNGLYIPIEVMNPETGIEVVEHDWFWKWRNYDPNSAAMFFPHRIAVDVFLWKFVMATGICGLAWVLGSHRDFIVSFVFVIFAMIIIGVLTLLVIKLKTSTG